MPARSNNFQKIVKYIYEQISTGAKVTESGMLTEPDGTQREVDILIEWEFAGATHVMAVECREHSRQQNILWVDQLIGKYKNLKVNKIIAISSSKFYRAAKNKAQQENIDLITVNEALTKNWRNDIERWKMMTHSFTLMRITTVKKSGAIFTQSEISENGRTASHRDQESEFMYNVLHPFFMTNMSTKVAAMIEEQISPRWQDFIDDPTPRWAEFTIGNPGIKKHGVPVDIEKIIFGVATFFHVGSPSNHFALSKHALSHVKIKTMASETDWKFVFDASAHPVAVDFGNGTVIRAPITDGFHSVKISG